jgi:hypothetical protein
MKCIKAAGDRKPTPVCRALPCARDYSAKQHNEFMLNLIIGLCCKICEANLILNLHRSTITLQGAQV